MGLSAIAAIRPLHLPLRELVTVAKPGITAANALMTLGGLALARNADQSTALFAAAGTALTVASAGALNMLLERDRDALMERTSSRPLPSGRLSVAACALASVVWGTCGLLMLALFVNPLTAWLGAAAHVMYVCVYTPLKYRSWLSVYPGAIAGAMPPLMGWTAASGHIEAPGLALFAILFLWQIPHVLAIGIFRKAEYQRAGIGTFAHAFTNRKAAVHAAVVCALLLACATLPAVLGQAGQLYLWFSTAAGMAYLASALRACVAPEAGARMLFFTSLGYLPAVALGLFLP